jgi:uncharacterized membrane-anchored protein
MGRGGRDGQSARAFSAIIVILFLIIDRGTGLIEMLLAGIGGGIVFYCAITDDVWS